MEGGQTGGGACTCIPVRCPPRVPESGSTLNNLRGANHTSRVRATASERVNPFLTSREWARRHRQLGIFSSLPLSLD